LTTNNNKGGKIRKPLNPFKADKPAMDYAIKNGISYLEAFRLRACLLAINAELLQERRYREYEAMEEDDTETKRVRWRQLLAFQDFIEKLKVSATWDGKKPRINEHLNEIYNDGNELRLREKHRKLKAELEELEELLRLMASVGYGPDRLRHVWERSHGNFHRFT
jgi:arginine utilization protein RocB